MSNNNLHESRIVYVTIFVFILILGFSMFSVFAETPNSQTVSTINGRLDVKHLTVPSDPIINEDTKLKIDFINPKTQKIQESVDYRISIQKNSVEIFESNLVHTSTGSVIFPFKFKESGSYDVFVNVFGILSSTISKETAWFTITVAENTEENSPHDGEKSNNEIEEELADEPMHETEEDNHVHDSILAESAKWMGLATLLVATPIFAIRMRSANQLTCKDAVLILAVGVGIMHILLFPEHLEDEGIGHGMLFAIAGIGQIGFGLLFMARPGIKLVIIGAAGTIASIVLYFITRVVDLPAPFGGPEDVDLIGIIAKIVEICLVILLIYFAKQIKKEEQLPLTATV